ncbi:MAG TPA: acireductone dioxygenase [Pseudomonadales bacterium]|nr:acireductone dioxygenase [Pseudomonadales bacterium]
MSRLRIFDDARPDTVLAEHGDGAAIATALTDIGVRFERWDTQAGITAGAEPDDVLAAYRPQIDALMAAEGYRSCDVVSMGPDHPQKAQMRTKFLDEHTHAEDEVRFFVDGQGLFTLHVDDEVYEILCERGDLIAVPAGTRHWFDMGPNPSFVAVRLFTNPDGWAADFTGTAIAQRFPRLDN